jgi:hypothetical protein
MCLSKEEVVSMRALADMTQETVELAQSLYDSVGSPESTNPASENSVRKASPHPSQIPLFYGRPTERCKV